jgi:hypothetical protein
VVNGCILELNNREAIGLSHQGDLYGKRQLIADWFISIPLLVKLLSLRGEGCGGCETNVSGFPLN